ncbi:MAG: hypothetical protein ACR2IQ_02990 [Minisyncoccia bacterium]
MNKLFTIIVFVAGMVINTWAQEPPKNDLPIAKKSLTMAEQKKLLLSDASVAQNFYFASVSEVKSSIVSNLNSYSKDQGWVFEDGAPVEFVQEDLEKYFDNYFVEKEFTFKKGDYNISYFDKETKKIKSYAYRANKINEKFICFDPNQIPDIKNKGILKVVPIISEVCGNMIGPADVSLPEPASVKLNEDGETLDTTKTVYKYSDKNGNVFITINNTVKSEQKTGDVKVDVSDPTPVVASNTVDNSKPYQRLGTDYSPQTTTTVPATNYIVVNPEHENTYVRDKKGVFWWYAGSVLTRVTEAVLLAYLYRQSYNYYDYMGYRYQYFTPPADYRYQVWQENDRKRNNATIQGSAGNAQVNRTIQGSAGYNSNYGLIEASSHW